MPLSPSFIKQLHFLGRGHQTAVILVSDIVLVNGLWYVWCTLIVWVSHGCSLLWAAVAVRVHRRFWRFEWMRPAGGEQAGGQESSALC